VVVKAMDKLELTAVARRVGIPVPATFEEELPADWVGPAVVKARLRVRPDNPHAIRFLDTRLVPGRHEAAERGEEIRRSGGIPVYQEVVSGRLVAHVMLAGPDGATLAELAQVSDRIWPPQAGISTRARTVSPSPELSGLTAALLQELEWFGLAQLQFIAPDEGEPLLIDFNGRFYGSLSLAVSAGLNLPAWWASLATGHPPPPARAGRYGVRYQWLEGDIRAAIADGSHPIRQVLGCFRYAAGATHSIWSVRDPAPALRHAAELLGRAVRGLLRWKSSGSSTR
jgi:hypothetical protein